MDVLDDGDVVTHSGLMATAEKYIVHGLYAKSSGKINPIPKNSISQVEGYGLELIANLMKTSDNQLRMYGSPEELLVNLHAYRGFASNHQVFKTSKCEPYNFNMNRYECDGKAYAFKQNIFQVLSKMPYDNFGFDFNYSEAFCTLFIRLREEKLGVGIHLLAFKEEVNKFSGLIAKEVNSPQVTNIDGSLNEFYSCNLEGFVNKWRSLLMEPVSEEDFKPIKERLVQAFSSPSFDEDFNKYMMAYLYIRNRIRFIAGLMMKIPSAFSREFNKSKSLDSHSLRVLSDEGKKYVVLKEIEAIMKVTSKNSGSSSTAKNRYIEAVPIEEVPIEYKEVMNSVKLVRGEIMRTKHRAVPLLNPQGGHMILAADSLFETLRDLIFGAEMFQKIKVDDWPYVATLLGFDAYYNATIESVYFMDYDEHRSITSKILKRFESLKNVPAKYVRNAKKDGFTEQNLKNELCNLGLDKVFHEITEFSQLSYKKVMKEKKGSVLRTCDLFEAVENCQVASLLSRLPYLRKFLHNQKACHRVVCIPCSRCQHIQSLNPPTRTAANKYAKLEDKDMKITTEIINNGNFGSEKIFTLTTPDGTQLLSNHVICLKNAPQGGNHNQIHTIIDGHTAKLLTEVWGKPIIDDKLLSDDQKRKLVSCNTPISKAIPNRKLYLRTVCSTAINPEQNRRVFVHELREILVLLLTREKVSPDRVKETTSKYCDEWHSVEGFNTIGLEEFYVAMEDLGLNANHITLVPDADLLYSTTYQYFVEYGYSATFLRGPYDYKLISVENAIFMIYQGLVTEVDWRIDGQCKCGNSKHCKQELRGRIIQTISAFAALNLGTYIKFDDPESKLKKISLCCTKQSTSLMPFTPTLELFSCDFSDTISLVYLLEKYKQFGFHNDFSLKDFTMAQLEQVRVPAWKARIIFLIKWLDMFFDKSDHFLRNMVMESILIRIPSFQKGKNPMDVLFSLDQEVLNEEYRICYENAKDFDNQPKPHPIVGEVVNEKVEVCKKRQLMMQKIIWSKSMDATAYKLKTAKCQTEYISDVDKKYKSKQEEITNQFRENHIIVRNVFMIDKKEEPKGSSLLTGNCVSCAETRADVQRSLAGFEKQQKHLDEAVQSSKDYERKWRESIQSGLATQRKLVECEKEAQKDRSRISKLEAKYQSAQKEVTTLKNEITKKNSDLKKKTATFSKNESHLKDEVARLHNDMKSQKSKNCTLQEQLEESRKESAEKAKEVEELKKMVEQLKEEKRILTLPNDEKDKRITSLTEQLMAQEKLRLHPEVSEYIIDLQVNRDGMGNGMAVIEAETMIREFKKFRSTDVIAKNRATVELCEFRKQYQKYMDGIDQNIKTIQSNILIRVDEIPPLPDFPSFSDDFLRLYNQKKQEEEDERLCLICFEKMEQGRTVTSCSSCPINYHIKCINEWISKNPVCPTCNRQWGS